jgi:hypothetical protein
MNIRIDLLDVTDSEFEKMILLSITRAGFMRKEPDKSWTVTEKKEAVRYLLMYQLGELLK